MEKNQELQEQKTAPNLVWDVQKDFPEVVMAQLNFEGWNEVNSIKGKRTLLTEGTTYVRIITFTFYYFQRYLKEDSRCLIQIILYNIYNMHNIVYIYIYNNNSAESNSSWFQCIKKMSPQFLKILSKDAKKTVA